MVPEVRWRKQQSLIDEIHTYTMDLEVMKTLQHEARTEKERERLGTIIQVMEEVMLRLHEKL
jgi:hypothetical protein